MELKYSEIQPKLQSLSELADAKLPIKLTRGIAKNIKILREELDILEKQRLDICKELADKDENGEPITEDGKFKMTNEAQAKFVKEYEKILSEVIDVDIVTVSETVLDQCEGDQYQTLTVKDILALDFMME